MGACEVIDNAGRGDRECFSCRFSVDFSESYKTHLEAGQENTHLANTT